MDIEQMIASCLARIHIIHPTSTTQIIAALEVIRHTLDQRLRLHQNMSTQNGNSNHLNSIPPDMIIIDSLYTCFESIDKRMEDLPSTTSEKSGLSGRHDVVRQLKRIYMGHSVFIAASRTTQENVSSITMNHTESWKKIVTHQLPLDRVMENSKEEQDGFDFVALLQSNKATDRSVQSWTHVIPFSITEKGIQCSF
jgi:translation initiation factor 2B subunit (eIF-2B alpha/beta/delta family)